MFFAPIVTSIVTIALVWTLLYYPKIGLFAMAPAGFFGIDPKYTDYTCKLQEMLLSASYFDLLNLGPILTANRFHLECGSHQGIYNPGIFVTV